MNKHCITSWIVALAICMSMCAGASARAQTEPTRYYVIHDGQREELVDLNGDTPPIADRKLDFISTLYRSGDSVQEVLAYMLCEVLPVTADADEPDDASDTRYALLAADGRVLHDYDESVYSYSVVGRYIEEYRASGKNEQGQVLRSVIDPATGENVDMIPGYEPEDISECGDGYLVTVPNDTPKDMPHPDDEESDKLYMSSNTVYYLDADLKQVFSSQCAYACEQSWEDETVIQVEKGDGITLYDFSGRVVAGPFKAAGFVYDGIGSWRLLVSINGKDFIINKRDGTLTPYNGYVLTFTGGLACEDTNASQRVVDMDGREVLPAIKGYYFFSDTSPILAVYYGSQWRYEVYARDGSMVTGGDTAYTMGGLIEERNAVYVGDGQSVVFFDAQCERRLTPSIPEGARVTNIREVCGRLVLTYESREDDRYFWYSAFVSDGLVIEPERYAYIYANYGNSDKHILVSQWIRGREYMGLLDGKGNTVLPCRYDSIWREDDLLAVRMGTWYGLIDYEGKWIVRKSCVKNMEE